MRHHLRVTLGTVLIGVILIGVVSLPGCKKSSEKASTSESPNGVEDPTANRSRSSSRSTPIQTRHVMPTVKLPEKFAKTCLVKVDDTMPDVTLNDLRDQPVLLSSLAGEKLTVVYFWKVNLPPEPGKPPYPNSKLSQLQTYIFEPYSPKGVNVVAINEDDPPRQAADAFYKEKATYPCLLDPRGKYFAKIATQDVPRVYLLDPTGKILWFDVQFSSSSLEDLDQAIQSVVEEDKK